MKALIEGGVVRVGAICASISGLFLVILIIWIPSAEIAFDIRDDHQIVEATGMDGGRRLTFAEMKDQLMETEVGSYGRAERFRPVYWALRIVEFRLWDDSPEVWRASRIAALSVVFAGLLWLTIEKFGIFLGTAVSVIISSRPMLFELFAKLGTSEYYASIAALIFCLGLRLFFKRPIAGGITALAGYCGMAGSKESFLVFILFLLILPFYCENRRARNAGVLFATLGVIFSAAVILGFAPEVMAKGSDIYSNKVGLVGRFLAGFTWLAIVPLLCVITMFVLDRLDGRNAFDDRKIPICSAMVLLLFMAFLFNLYYYGEKFGSVLRYQFPGEILVIICIAIVIHRLFTSQSLSKSFEKHWPSTVTISTTGVVILSLLFSLFGFAEQRKLIACQVKKTKALEAFVGKAVDELKESQRDVVLVLDRSVATELQYEYLHSFSSFIRAKKKSSEPLRLYFLDDSERIESSDLGRVLLSLLEAKAEEGDRFTSISGAGIDGPILAVSVLGDLSRRFESFLVWEQWLEESDANCRN